LAVERHDRQDPCSVRVERHDRQAGVPLIKKQRAPGTNQRARCRPIDMAKVGFVVGNGRTRVPQESITNAIDDASYLSIELMRAGRLFRRCSKFSPPNGVGTERRLPFWRDIPECVPCRQIILIDAHDSSASGSCKLNRDNRDDFRGSGSRSYRVRRFGSALTAHVRGPGGSIECDADVCGGRGSGRARSSHHLGFNRIRRRSAHRRIAYEPTREARMKNHSISGRSVRE
jgi:hypothetical protein